MTWNPEMGFMLVARGGGAIEGGSYWERAMMPRR
jgi:hypothetical protein